MHGVRRHVGDRVEFAPGDGAVEIGEAMGNPILVAEGVEPVLLRLDRRDQLDAGQRAEGARMLGGHASRSDDHQPDDDRA